MGKPVKISDRDRKWFQPRPKAGARAYATRLARQRFLIVCEGTKTEPSYFTAIARKLPPHAVAVEVVGEGKNTLSLVRRAQDRRDSPRRIGPPFDRVWVVFDLDSFDADAFDNAIHKAEADAIGCAWSNEAIELWYLLHFEDRQTAMARSEYQAKLSDHLGAPYHKNAKDMYERLAARGDPAAAARRAKRLEKLHVGLPPSKANPCTTVYKLVAELRKFEVPPKAP